MNVLSTDLASVKSIAIKNCREIRFSHGGHLFAVVNQYNFEVYNFYTFESPSYYKLNRGHTGRPRCINWYEDDSGFSSCGLDSNIYQWDLAKYKDKELRDTDYDFNSPGTMFPSLALINGDERKLFASCTNKTIKEIERGKDPPN